jgi:hypothetical protein
VAQGEGPELKPQYHIKKKKKEFWKEKRGDMRKEMRGKEMSSPDR